MNPVIKPFTQIQLIDIPFINHQHLADLKNILTISSPDVVKGFFVTPDAFKMFIEENKLDAALEGILDKSVMNEFSKIAEAGKTARQLITMNALPHTLELEIRNAHYNLCGEESNISVSLYCSECANGFPFQQLEHLVNIEGEDALIHGIHKCFASAFTEKAIFERQQKGVGNTAINLSISVEKIQNAKYSSSNQSFKIDPLKGFDKMMSFKTAEKMG